MVEKTMDFLLSTSQLKNILHLYCNPKTWKSVDVCAINELPGQLLMVDKPAAFIVNSDPNFKPGKHWMVIFLPKTKSGICNSAAEFFDPQGLPPSAYGKEIVKFLKANSDFQYAFNSLQVQEDWSSICRLYCCYYILNRFQGQSMRDIISDLFSMDEDMLKSNFYDGLYLLSL